MNTAATNSNQSTEKRSLLQVMQASQTAQEQAPVIKPIKWLTNYNGKLGCAAFLHIDLAPTKFPPRRSLDEIVFEISTEDHSHPPVKAKLFDMLPLNLWQVGDCVTLASHGINADQFFNFLREQHPKLRIDGTTPVVIYQYVKML
jgi:hypothetical protein